MANLSVENLNQILNTGDVENLMNGGSAAPMSDARVMKEMHAQGMQAPAPTGETNFSDMLRKSVDQVNADQLQANQAIGDLVAGRNKNIHETMLAIEKADTSLKLMMQVRNKVLDAYKEVIRMQV